MNDLPCEREYEYTLLLEGDVRRDVWWCINDHTGCLYNDGHNECMHEGLSLSPLEDDNG